MISVAYLFPGQGSQALGMLADIESLVADTFAEASAVVGYDLWQLISEDPQDQLNQTEFTQPAVLASSIALYRLALKEGLPPPEVVAGHSLGEYSALVAAKVLQFSDALVLVQQRGRFMQTAVPIGEGSMAAVMGLADDKVRDLCKAVARGQVLQAANYNAPGQVVIAGATEAVDRGIEACRSAGAKRALLLPVSAPFHSALMRPAAENMAEILESVNFYKPEMPVLQNVDAAVHLDPEVIKENLIAQMCGAVLWTDTVISLAKMGVTNLIECGPGKVLAGLVKRIDRSLTIHHIHSLELINDVREAVVP